jgi:hypothetical protein
MPLPTSDIERLARFKPQKPVQFGTKNRVRLRGMRMRGIKRKKAPVIWWSF